MNIHTAIQKYITAKIADDRADRTIADYHRVLDRYADHVNGQPVDAWTRDDARSYVASLRTDTTWAKNTIALHVRNLRAFWHWLYDEGYTDHDLSAAIKSPKSLPRRERLLTLGEFAQLLAACAGDAQALRDRAIILFMADSGLRRADIPPLNRDLIVWADDGTAWLLVRDQKTGRDHLSSIGQTTAAALRGYLDSRTDDHPALFLSRYGRRFAERGDAVYSLLNLRAKKAGLDPDLVHPHLLRKIFATWWVEAGGDEHRLQTLGGWATPDMLRLYVRLYAVDQLRDGHRQYSPVEYFIRKTE